MEGPMKDSKNNLFLITGTILLDLQENNQMTDKYFYMKNPIESLRDIVSTSTNTDMIRQTVTISTISWFGSLQLCGNSADVIQKSQNYASILNRDVLGLEDVIASNKYKSEQSEPKRKMTESDVLQTS
ncbi:8682_t:CDS:2 [Funneliformis mosseae]|uniref:8682_t:CDS:1 n=1 Tax=Funneliformis mosseae TaxID=27381 RepID=A0A9N9DFB4_FUNMO|nr:8682_t:CDS:2 [Funneliformis mosseae]